MLGIKIILWAGLAFYAILGTGCATTMPREGMTIDSFWEGVRILYPAMERPSSEFYNHYDIPDSCDGLFVVQEEFPAQIVVKRAYDEIGASFHCWYFLWHRDGKVECLGEYARREPGAIEHGQARWGVPMPLFFGTLKGFEWSLFDSWISSPDWWIRAWAMMRLAEVQERDADEGSRRCISSLGDPVWQVRAASCSTLSKLLDKGARVTEEMKRRLTMMLFEPGFWVRCDAAELMLAHPEAADWEGLCKAIRSQIGRWMRGERAFGTGTVGKRLRLEDDTIGDVEEMLLALQHGKDRTLIGFLSEVLTSDYEFMPDNPRRLLHIAAAESGYSILGGTSQPGRSLDSVDRAGIVDEWRQKMR